MDSFVGKKLLMAFLASVLLGVLLFGFENCASVDNEMASKKIQIDNQSCPFIAKSKTVSE